LKGDRGQCLVFPLDLHALLRLDRLVKAVRPASSGHKPSGKFISAASLGFDELAADFLFVKAVLYFGGHYLSDREYIWLYHLLDTSTTLSPHFEEVYEFGAIVLSLEARQADKAILAIKGTTETTCSGRIKADLVAEAMPVLIMEAA